MGKLKPLLVRFFLSAGRIAALKVSPVPVRLQNSANAQDCDMLSMQSKRNFERNMSSALLCVLWEYT
jgi:hypothetical protein